MSDSAIKSVNEDHFLDLCNTITIDINKKQSIGVDEIESEPQIKSFPFGSGTTLADDEETVYFVFEPNDNVGEPIKSTSETDIQAPFKVLPSSIFSVDANSNASSNKRKGKFCLLSFLCIKLFLKNMKYFTLV